MPHANYFSANDGLNVGQFGGRAAGAAATTPSRPVSSTSLVNRKQINIKVDPQFQRAMSRCQLQLDRTTTPMPLELARRDWQQLYIGLMFSVNFASTISADD
jgi:hypothetical protein